MGQKKADSKEELKNQLNSLSYYVTQEEGTEPPFQNEYWDKKEEGLYVDIVSGEPLFASIHKYDSGSGWPSFTSPLVSENIVKKEDHQLPGSPRTEVRSREGDSHLGHVFPDGPTEGEGASGLRYCINSAALRFIPKHQLKDEGYEDYLPLFDQ